MFCHVWTCQDVIVIVDPMAAASNTFHVLNPGSGAKGHGYVTCSLPKLLHCLRWCCTPSYLAIWLPSHHQHILPPRMAWSHVFPADNKGRMRHSSSCNSLPWAQCYWGMSFMASRWSSVHPRSPPWGNVEYVSFASVVPEGASCSSIGSQGAVTLQSGAAVACRLGLDLGSSGTWHEKPPNVRSLQITVAASDAIKSSSSTYTPSPV